MGILETLKETEKSGFGFSPALKNETFQRVVSYPWAYGFSTR